MAAALVGTLVISNARSDEPSREQLLSWLRALQSLQKVHYSWPIAPEMLRGDDPLLVEYVRLTSAVSLRAENCTPAQIEAAVRVCDRVNQSNPKQPARLGMHYSPWAREFAKDLPPTDTGPSCQRELALFRQRMDAARSMLDAANRRWHSRVGVGAIMLDCERFELKAGDAAWNAAVTEKLNQVYDMARAAFPDARIEWYNRGAIQRAERGDGWAANPYSTGEERGDAFACSLYQLGDLGYTRETFRRTVENANRHGIKEVTPWVALACGFRPTLNGVKWTFEWDYDLYNSWQMGQEINHPWYGKREQHARFAPWNAASIVIFYPEPFGRSSAWGRHFVAYVRGANDVKELPQ